MKTYRISKYDPTKRAENGVYLLDEWTSISDIGKIFPGGVLNANEYYKIENEYVSTFREIVEWLKIDTLHIRRFESSSRFPNASRYKKHPVLSIDEACDFLTLCLREYCWGIIKSRRLFNFSAYVGYDYYLYINTLLDMSEIDSFARQNNLYCELCN